MDRVHNRICPCFSFRALRAAGVCTVVFPFGCRVNSHLHRCKGILGARRGSASCAGIEIRRFRSPPRPCSALSDAGTQFFAGRVGRRDDGASSPGQTDSHDPRPCQTLRRKRKVWHPAPFLLDHARPAFFSARRKENGGCILRGEPAVPSRAAGGKCRGGDAVAAPIVPIDPAFAGNSLSGDFLHGEGLDDVACSGKAPLSRSLPGGHHPRRAEPACGKVSSDDETLGPAEAGRRCGAQEGGRGPWRRGESVPYLGISSMVKASIMSPSLMSLNFSTVRPHS